MKITFKLLALLCAVILISSCEVTRNENGVCKGAPVDEFYTGECHSDWDRELCDDFDNRQVNGTDWTWIPGGSCY